MLEFLLSIDRALFLFFHLSLTAPWLDGLMAAISFITIGPWLFVVLWATFMIGGHARERWMGLYLIPTAFISDAIPSVLKSLFERPRPYLAMPHILPLVDTTELGIYAFPSHHAANSFALAVFFSLVTKSKRLRAAFFLAAAFVSYSRVYVGVHYPLDVLGGGVVGSLWGFIAGVVWIRIISRKIPVS